VDCLLDALCDPASPTSLFLVKNTTDTGNDPGASESPSSSSSPPTFAIEFFRGFGGVRVEDSVRRWRGMGVAALYPSQKIQQTYEI
jgi:hypothetical protein